MLELISNPWLYALVALLLIFRNIVVALPKPGESTQPTGFGSNSPGYRFTYKLLQGISGDVRAMGFDPKSVGQAVMKKKDADATMRIDPPRKDK